MDDGTSILLKEYELATQHYFHEDNRQMTKLASALTLNAAFIGIMTLFGSLIDEIATTDYLPLSGICFVALLINIMYVIMMNRGRYYRDSRIARAKEIENILKKKSLLKSDMLFSHFHKYLHDSDTKPKRFERIAATKGIMACICIIGCLWLITGLFFFIKWFPFVIQYCEST